MCKFVDFCASSSNDADWDSFYSFPVDVKARILYLCLTGVCKSTKSASKCVGLDSHGWAVTSILKCYGLVGNNIGRYSGNNLGLRDFKELVRQHPDGVLTPDNGDSMDKWVRAIVSKNKHYLRNIDSLPADKKFVTEIPVAESGFKRNIVVVCIFIFVVIVFVVELLFS